MIVCPNCNHQNPDGATQCEACYTPLPATTNCPNCGATVQTDANFCGQCGYNLQAGTAPTPEVERTMVPNPITAAAPELGLPDLISPDPLIEPEPLVSEGLPVEQETSQSSNVAVSSNLQPTPLPDNELAAPKQASSAPTKAIVGESRTQLQQQSAQFLHIRTNTQIELPPNLTVIHIGKPNDRIPPDIDVSGFPDSEIVSRIHADVRLEGDAYYIEDTGSSNGTYVNNVPLPVGNRHRLRPGDRIALGKGDRVTFLFQLT